MSINQADLPPPYIGLVYYAVGWYTLQEEHLSDDGSSASLLSVGDGGLPFWEYHWSGYVRRH